MKRRLIKFPVIATEGLAMLSKLRPHLTYANVISTLSLFIVLGGSSYAAIQLSNGSVKTKHIAKNAVTTKKVRDASLLAQDFAPNQLPQGPKGDTGDTGPQGIPGPVDTSALQTKVAKSGDTLTGMVTEIAPLAKVPGSSAIAGVPSCQRVSPSRRTTSSPRRTPNVPASARRRPAGSAST